MTFLSYYRLSSTLLILTGLFSIMITGNYLLPVFLGMATAILSYLTKDRLGEYLNIPKWSWNALALLFLIYFTYDSFFGELDLVGNGIKFVVYLQVVKLLSPKTNRDQIQVYLLSFLHVLASTVLSSNVTFAFPFLVYIILATWTLSLFNLKVRYEESLRETKKDTGIKTLYRSRDIITPQYLLTTSLLSISIIAFTLLVFFSFPRVSFRNFLQRTAKPQSISGFSEQVELGTIGTIKTNQSIALRVEISDKELDRVNIENLYWRGTAADYFDGRTWSKTWTNLGRAPINRDTWEMETKMRPLPGWVEIEYRVFLEALSTPILFGADRLKTVTWDKSIAERFMRNSISLGKDEYSGYRFFSATNFVSDLTYKASSYVGRRPAELLRQDNREDFPWWIENYYKQLPDLDPEVSNLLENIPVTGDNNYDKALEIVDFIESNYEYTLQVEDMQTDDPLRFFFIESKKGHCEYLSTALIVALRYYGIPARQVMGFRGGQLNPYGSYLAVRQSDAHTWVEVYFPKYGWIRFDPSPPDATVQSPQTRFLTFYQMMDYLRLRWNKYIIEYDMSSQAAAVEKGVRTIMSVLRTKDTEKELERDEDIPQRKVFLKKPFFYTVGGTLFLLCVFLFVRARRKPSDAPGSRPFPPYFSAAVRFLEGKGCKKEEGQTLREFAHLAESRMGTLPSLHVLVDWYYAERFGSRKIPASSWKNRYEELRRETSKAYQENRAHNCDDREAA